MTGLEPELLRRLGAGESIAAVIQAAGLSRGEFDAAWRAELARRLPDLQGVRTGAVSGRVTIARDRWGIPHVQGRTDADVMFGAGYALAQDRLFQIDWYRRRALGQVSEVLGKAGLVEDTIARTVGLNRIVAGQARALPDESRALLEAYTAGINAYIDEAGAMLPIEFALLDYEPRPWTVGDSLAVALEFSYYLTVRFPVLVLPELAQRHLQDERLFAAYLTGESIEETIVPPCTYPLAPGAVRPMSHSAGDPDAGIGSNNWVVDGAHAANGRPLVASDPHIGFSTTSCWHEIRLQGGSFDVAGMAYAGFPGMLVGRTRGVAWGFTNNASCSQRDLYQEKTDPAHPNAFLFDGTWETARTVTETIAVRGEADVVKTVRYSRNGPIVDELLGIGADTGPVSLKWLGDGPDSWIPPLLDMMRTETCESFRAALKPWVCPSNCLVFGDTKGHIGFHCTGNIPLRQAHARGYRPGWDPAHQWTGCIPFEGMPQLADPQRGWIATANNPPAPDDFPYPLSGIWTAGERAKRLREMLEGRPRFDIAAFQDMQHDQLSVRARRAAPRLAAILARSEDQALREAGRHFIAWDHRITVDSVAAMLFEAFTVHWCLRVARERFPEALALAAAPAIPGLAMELLHGDTAGWFPDGGVAAGVEEAMRDAMAELARRLGDDMATWRYGRLHVLQLRHFLSGRGDLGTLLNRTGPATGGSMVTVSNTHLGPDYESTGGATCRFVADLSAPEAEYWNVLPQGTSGHPGSPHYCDQAAAWVHRGYHRVSFSGPDGDAGCVRQLAIDPA